MSIKNCLSLILGAAIFVSYHPLVAIAEPSFQRDYDYKTPLPQTGRVTIRRLLEDLPAENLFEKCPTRSKLQDFAESSNVLVMICRDQVNTLQKYWIQKDKRTEEIVRLKALDEPRMESVLFQNGDNSLYLYGDGLGLINAYLESYNEQTKQGIGEALLYHYNEFYTEEYLATQRQREMRNSNR
jgi:hypothetical protein